jgi:hypothetical protein
LSSFVHIFQKNNPKLQTSGKRAKKGEAGARYKNWGVVLSEMGPSVRHDKHDYFARLVLKNSAEGTTEHLILEPGTSLKFEGYGNKKFFFYAARKLPDSPHWYLCVEDESKILYFMAQSKLFEVLNESPIPEILQRQQEWWQQIRTTLPSRKDHSTSRTKIQLQLPDDSSRRDVSREIQDALIPFCTTLDQLPVIISHEIEKVIEQIILREVERIMEQVTEKILHKIEERDEDKWMRLLEKALDRIGK